MTPHTRFDDAWGAAQEQARALAAEGRDVVLVRDLLGRASLLVDDTGKPLPDEERASISDAFCRATGPFTGLEPVLPASEMFSPDMFFEAPELISHQEPADGFPGRVRILDRTVVGADWTSAPVPGSSVSAIDRRIALYGFKGGVGRSTATTVLARELADRGRCVLVIDLDLESPGVSALLRDADALPEHGVVDHLVEDAVGNADGLDLVVKSDVLSITGTGEVWLAPAGGRPREGYDFLAKMNRVYTDLPADEPGQDRPFARRLDNAITACEQRVTALSRPPDIVLLDSRAGVHDIAAVAITQLSGLALLFAVDNPATWQGYGMLCKQWADQPERARTVREKLRLVASMLPQQDWEERLARIREKAWETFEVLYDNEDGVDLCAYNPPLEDDNAPHAPIPVFFSSDLVALDPAGDRDWITYSLIMGAYEQFLHRLLSVLPEPYGEET